MDKILIQENKALKLLSRYCLWLIIFAFIIILWGAFVKISLSGDGCGKHWPFCEGALVPSSLTEDRSLFIEYFHRIKSAFFGLLVVILTTICYRYRKIAPHIFFWSAASLLFTILEGAIGAALVLQGWVAGTASWERFIIGSLHLVNTLFLLASLVATYHHCLAYNERRFSIFYFKKELILIIILAITGAWSSIATTVSPSTSLIAGLYQDLNLSAEEPHNQLLRLKVVHPLIAVFISAILIFSFISAKRLLYLAHRHLLNTIIILTILQPLIGLATLIFLSPALGRLAHLAVADILWCLILYLGATNYPTAQKEEV